MAHMINFGFHSNSFGQVDCDMVCRQLTEGRIKERRPVGSPKSPESDLWDLWQLIPKTFVFETCDFQEMWYEWWPDLIWVAPWLTPELTGPPLRVEYHRHHCHLHPHPKSPRCGSGCGQEVLGWSGNSRGTLHCRTRLRTHFHSAQENFHSAQMDFYSALEDFHSAQMDFYSSLEDFHSAWFWEDQATLTGNCRTCSSHTLSFSPRVFSLGPRIIFTQPRPMGFSLGPKSFDIIHSALCHCTLHYRKSLRTHLHLAKQYFYSVATDFHSILKDFTQVQKSFHSVLFHSAQEYFHWAVFTMCKDTPVSRLYCLPKITLYFSNKTLRIFEKNSMFMKLQLIVEKTISR